MIKAAIRVSVELFVRDNEAAEQICRDLMGDKRVMAGNVEWPNPLHASGPAILSWVRNSCGDDE